MTYSASLDIIDLHLLPKNWRILLLDEVAFVNETTSNLKEFSWINYTDISSVGTHTVDKPSRLEVKDAPSRARRVLKKGDTVISSVRPNRKSFFYYDGAWSNAIASTGFAVVSPKDAEDAEFLHAILTSDKAVKIYEAICEGGAYPAFNPNRLNELRIPWPSKLVRKALGQLVMNLQIKITINNSISKTLEDIAQTIYKSWFIDFDPVKAKMNGEKPVGMDDETAALFPDSFEESELGLIPKGWEVKCASELFQIGIGRTPPRKEPEWFCGGSDGIPWVSIRDMGTFETYSHGTKEGLTLDAVNRFKVPLVPENTVLMSFKLTVGKLCITDRDLVTNEAIAHFRITDKSPIESFYTYLWLSNIEMGNLDSTSSIGTATNSGVIKQIKFLVPIKGVLDCFLNTVNPVFLELKAIRRQSSNLIQIRDSLLPRLISGELQIPEEMLAS